MGKKTNFNKDETKKVLISYNNNDIIVDTIIHYGKPQFIVFQKDTKKIVFEEDIHIGKDKFYPIDLDSSFLTSGNLLLPTNLSDYGNLKSLLDEIRKYVYKYVDVSDIFLDIIPYYVLLTYIYNNFCEIPYLRVIGDYGSGKSRFMKVIGNICYNSIITNGGTSAPAMFRIIEKIKGTLVIDEADFQFSDASNDIIKILNNGFQKGNPILKADGEKFEPRAYNVYGPKIIGGRMEFRDKATESRCILEIMKRTERKDIPLNLSDTFSAESEELRNKLFRFRYDYIDKIGIKEERIDGLEGRLNQILNPILSIINFIGRVDDYHKVINYFLSRQKCIKEDRRFTNEGIIFIAIKKRQDNRSSFIYFHELLDDLRQEDNSILMNSRKLGSLLRQYEIRPIRRNGGFGLDLSDNNKLLEHIYKSFGLLDK